MLYKVYNFINRHVKNKNCIYNLMKSKSLKKIKCIKKKNRLTYKNNIKRIKNYKKRSCVFNRIKLGLSR